MKWFWVWLTALAALAPAQYVGSKACFGCHAGIYNSYRKTAMGRSMTPAAGWQPGTLPAQAEVPAKPGSTLAFSVAHQDGAWYQAETEPGVFSIRHPLQYAVGSGVNGLTFLIRNGNYLLQAPLSFYARAGKWDLSPGYENSSLGFNRVAPGECVNCHAGRASPALDSTGAYADPPFQELAIGCENCHGPGQAHVKSGGKLRASIVNPAKLAPRLAENICMNCHQTGDSRLLQVGKQYQDFRPGQWLFDTAVIVRQPEQQAQSDLLEHHSAMQASRCFRASAGKLSCLTCHDPHVEIRAPEAVSYYRAKCLTCHNEQSCPLSLKTRQTQTPADDCAGCHMLKRNPGQISHAALTNHRIPARADEPMPAAAPSLIDGVQVMNPPDTPAVHLQPVILLRAYEALAPKNPDYQGRYRDLLRQLSASLPTDPYVQASLGRQAASDGHAEEAVAHFKQGASLNSPALYLELGQALAGLGQNAEAIEYLKKGAVLDPYNPVLAKTLILQCINSKDYAEARSRMESYVATFPEDGLMRSLLAKVSR